jgi:hypothetical protein
MRLAAPRYLVIDLPQPLSDSPTADTEKVWASPNIFCIPRENVDSTVPVAVNRDTTTGTVMHSVAEIFL